MRKEGDYLWHVKPVWDHNSVAAWQGIISRGRQQLEPGAAGREAGERERQGAPSGKACDRLSLPEQPTARPLHGMCCRLESDPSKNEERFGGKRGREHTPYWPVVVHKQGVVFETRCCLWSGTCWFSNWDAVSSARWGKQGMGALGQGETSALRLPSHWIFSATCSLVSGEGRVGAHVPQDFLSLEIPSCTSVGSVGV